MKGPAVALVLLRTVSPDTSDTMRQVLLLFWLLTEVKKEVKVGKVKPTLQGQF